MINEGASVHSVAKLLSLFQFFNLALLQFEGRFSRAAMDSIAHQKIVNPCS
jgi:hypothetical protein